MSVLHYTRSDPSQFSIYPKQYRNLYRCLSTYHENLGAVVDSLCINRSNSTCDNATSTSPLHGTTTPALIEESHREVAAQDLIPSALLDCIVATYLPPSNP
ncbi:hypothetical protein C5167_005981 [Papaver somniferum]|uniref:Uncharacterized protein n=1 Tax=Papaver somniferum TaxID=3469 RepID=A0A4Y7JFZ7_PAPSO|nr:hypothetical protein C5167_005981 [Papaver somniferum]